MIPVRSGKRIPAGGLTASWKLWMCSGDAAEGMFGPSASNGGGITCDSERRSSTKRSSCDPCPALPPGKARSLGAPSRLRGNPSAARRKHYKGGKTGKVHSAPGSAGSSCSKIHPEYACQIKAGARQHGEHVKKQQLSHFLQPRRATRH